LSPTPPVECLSSTGPPSSQAGRPRVRHRPRQRDPLGHGEVAQEDAIAQAATCPSDASVGRSRPASDLYVLEPTAVARAPDELLGISRTRPLRAPRVAEPGEQVVEQPDAPNRKGAASPSPPRAARRRARGSPRPAPWCAPRRALKPPEPWSRTASSMIRAASGVAPGSRCPSRSSRSRRRLEGRAGRGLRSPPGRQRAGLEDDLDAGASCARGGDDGPPRPRGRRPARAPRQHDVDLVRPRRRRRRSRRAWPPRRAHRREVATAAIRIVRPAARPGRGRLCRRTHTAATGRPAWRPWRTARRSRRRPPPGEAREIDQRDSAAGVRVEVSGPSSHRSIRGASASAPALAAARVVLVAWRSSPTSL
jgi:hypothetical protein